MELRKIAAIGLALTLSACGTSAKSTDSSGHSTSQPSATATVRPSTSTPMPTPTAQPTKAAVEPGKYIKCTTKLTSDSGKPVLRGVRSGLHDTFDRLAFDFCRPAKAKVEVQQISRSEVSTDPRGQPIELEGNYFYKVIITSVDAHAIGYDTTVYKGVQPGHGTNNIVEFVFLGDDEGYVTYAVGVKRLRDTRILPPVTDPADPKHLVYSVDISH